MDGPRVRPFVEDPTAGGEDALCACLGTCKLPSPKLPEVLDGPTSFSGSRCVFTSDLTAVVDFPLFEPSNVSTSENVWFVEGGCARPPVWSFAASGACAVPFGPGTWFVVSMAA